jgi:hypothetical protein
MRRTLTLHFLGFVCLSSCGSNGTEQVAPDASRSSDAAGVTEAAVDAGANAMVGTATGTELFSVTQVQATLSHCDDQDQAQLLPNPPTIAGLRLLLEGAWVECPDPTVSGVWAFVLTGDKASGMTVNVYDYYELLFDEKGGLVQAKGPDQIGVWGLGGSDIFTEPDAGDSTPISTMPGLGTYMADGVSAGSYGYPIFEMNTPVRMYLYPDPTLKITRLGDVPNP